MVKESKVKDELIDNFDFKKIITKEDLIFEIESVSKSIENAKKTIAYNTIVLSEFNKLLEEFK